MRINNSVKNLLTTFIPYIIIGLLGFIRVKFFIQYLGEDISSINQLFYNILAYLSLAEGGIGLFIVQKYYKCFVENDQKHINTLYSTSKIFLRRVAFAMLGMGIVVSFFLPLFTKASISNFYLQTVFMIFLLKNVVDYFMYAPRLVIDADQKMYEVNLFINAIRILEIVAEIGLVLLGFDYLIVLIPGIVIRVIINFIINRKIQRLYPWLTDEKKYDKKEIKGIKNIIHQKISGLLYSNTDILIISSVLNPVSVVIYSSYNYITKYLYDIGYMVTQAISSSLGNVLYKEKIEKQIKIFDEVTILFYFIATLFTTLFLVLINPFVKLWVGEKYFMSSFGVYLIGTVMFFSIAGRAILMAKDNLGLFKETKNVILLESILNLVLSVFLIQFMGLEGVLLATILSTLVTTFWYIPNYIYKNYFQTSCFCYIKNYLLSLLITYILSFGLHLFLPKTVSNFFVWAIFACILGLITIFVLFGLYYVLFPSFRSLVEKGKQFFISKGGFMKKIFKKEMIVKIMIVFLIMQPILDIYLLFEPAVMNIFKVSPSTIIRMIFVGILVALSLFAIKWKKKKIWIILYFLIVICYTVFHCWNANQFHVNIPGNFGYSLISELFYLIRMLLPLLILLISSQIKVTFRQLEKIITWLVIFISGLIVVTNLLGISLNSYTNQTIGGTIIDWFANKEISYSSLASKGFFMYANQISALELLLTPILFYILFKNPTKKNMCLFVFQLLACFMLGTKVATLGFVMLLMIAGLLYFFFCFIKKELKFQFKIIGMLCFLGLLSGILLPVSPMTNRNTVTETIQNGHDTDKKCSELIFDFSNPIQYQVSEKEMIADSEDQCLSQNEFEQKKLKVVEEHLEQLETEAEKKQFLISFIEKEYDNFRIEATFVGKSYPCQYDPYFWYDVMHLPVSERMEYRILEEKMLQKVKQLNDNKKDDFLGISYTRMSNIYNLERDFLSHYYSLGFFGLLLFLFPYVIVLFVCIFAMLFHFKEKVTLYHCFLLLSFGITLCIAYYSGNVMDGLVVTLILGFVVGQFINSVFSKKSKSQDVKVSIIMPTYNDAETIKETLDSVESQTYQNLELIIVDDGSTDNTKKVIEAYQKKYDKITYVFQENSDQLKAIIHGTQYIKGDYVFILHSDDLLASPTVLEEAVRYMVEHPNLDGIIADLLMIDEHSKLIGKQKILEYHRKKTIPPLQLLWLGRNLYVDVGFFKKDVYLEKNKENYLTWNTPFWLTSKDHIEMMNIEAVDFEFIKYRVHSGNYIHSEIGTLNVINGELRTVTRLMKYYEIPNYAKQYLLFRVFAKLKWTSIYRPIYRKRETSNKAEILDFIIKKRFPEGYEQNIFLNSLVAFYKNENHRTIYFSKLYHDEPIYQGNEMRTFHKHLLENNLPDLYIKMMEEMKKGFDEIIVKKEDYEKATDLIQFLCIYPYVKVTKK